MSRESMAEILVGEIYDATTFDENRFRPMDPRRAKRLSYIMFSTCFNDAETMNRLAGAHMVSRSHRKANRKAKHK